jgi:lipopolysaccharide transport system ATP-binding protein
LKSDIAIQAEKLGKHYHLGGIRTNYKTLRGSITDSFTAPFRALRKGRAKGKGARSANEIWALKNVSFEVKRGEIVGIIGRNGAGKSTLLKILSRITEPTEGYADINGRVGSLLEVGTGFNPELTGRENTFLNGAILGMKRAEIMRKFDEIVAFAEVEKFIDTPVKHYSSGMYLRLAFAVAAHLEPEILLIDEVLAVGDLAFQKKCLGRMGEVAKEGRTVLFVSHNMSAVKELCQRGILIDSGSVAFNGDSSRCIAEYMNRLDSAAVTTGMNSRSFAIGVPTVRGTDGSKITSGKPFNITLPISGHEVQNPWMFFIVEDFTGRMLIHSRIKSRELGFEVIDGEYRLNLDIPSLWLSPGMYSAYFKFLFPSVKAATGRANSERFMLEVDGRFESTGKAILNPDIEWRLSSHVEEEELVSF